MDSLRSCSARARIPWKVTKRHKTHALWLAAKSRNIEIMRSLMGIGPDHESRAFRITISLSEQYAFLWRNGRFIVATPISSGTRSIPRREDNISLPTNTGIGNRPSIRPRCLSSCGCPAAILASTWAGAWLSWPRTGAFACLRDLRERFMPQCRWGRLSRSSRQPSIPKRQPPCPMIEMAARTRKKWDWRDATDTIWDSVGRHQQSMTLPSRPARNAPFARSQAGRGGRDSRSHCVPGVPRLKALHRRTVSRRLRPLSVLQLR
jgi:hypothetical protein